MIKYPLSDYTGVPEELRNGDWLPLLNSVDIEQNPANGQPILTATGVAAGTYGDAFNVAQFTVDSKGRISFAANVPLAAASGTVSNFIFTDGDGFDGTVLTATTTPTLSLKTTLTQGSVPFITATKGLGEDNALFFWDNTNKRLGIGNNAPVARLNVTGAAHIYNTFTHTAIGGVATYFLNTVNVPAGGIFNNGAVWAATLATNNMKFAGSVTTGNGAIVTGMAVSNTIEFTAGGATVSVGQATGIRALAGLQILSQTLGSFAGTVSHGASLMIQGVYTGGAATISFDNYYGILINRLDEWGALTITNRWAIYQQYASDPSYFAGQIQINNTTSQGAYKLQVTGGLYANVTGFTMRFVGLSTDNTSTQVLAKNASGDNVWRDASTIAGAPDTHTLLSSTIHTDTVTAAPVLGAMIYGNATPAWQRLDGHTVAAKRFLTQTGTGVVSAVPVWGVIAAGDIPDLSATYVPTTRTLTINGSAQDLSTNRTWTITVTGTANRITVTGGAGLTPTIDIAATYAGQASIITVGTITTGTWNGTAIGPTFGGTGITTYTLGDTLYASATNVLSKLAGNITTAKLFLSQTGTGAVSAAPVWSAMAGSDITGAALTKTDDTNVTLALGGTPATALLRATSITVGWTGTLAVTRGGTGLSAIAQGDILYGSGVNTYSALPKNAVATRYLSNTGTSNNPAWAQVDLSNGVTGTLPSASLGNGLARSVFGVTGNAAAARADIQATAADQVLVANGAGTAIVWGTVATGGITNSAVTYAKIQDVSATSRFLGRITAGAGVVEELTGTQATSLLDLFSTTTTTKGVVIGSNNVGTSFFLRADGTWAIPPVGGGSNHTLLSATHTDTVAATAVLGDMIYANASPAWQRLVGNITTAKQYLSQTGSGAVSAAPVWASIAGADVTGAALTKTDDTNVTLTLGGTPATALLRAASITVGWTGTLAVTRGGTGLAAVAQGDLLYGSAANTYSLLNKSVTANQYLKNSGTSNNPAWASLALTDITMNTNRILGRLTAGTGAIEELTGTQVTTMLDLFSTTATTKGVVPGSNSVGATFFLRADGTWAVPAGGVSNHNLLSAVHPDTVAGVPVLGDMIYANATPAWQKMSGNTSAVKQFLTQTGTGSVSAGPIWSAIAAADIPAGSGNYIQNQNAIAQPTSNYWISGNGRIYGTLTLGANGENTIGSTGTSGARTMHFGDVTLGIGSAAFYTMINNGMSSYLYVGQGAAPSTIHYAAIITTSASTGHASYASLSLGNYYNTMYMDGGNISIGVDLPSAARLYLEYNNPGSNQLGVYSRVFGKSNPSGNTAVSGWLDIGIAGAATAGDSFGVKGVVSIQNGATYNYTTSQELAGLLAGATVNSVGTTADRIACIRVYPAIINTASVGIMYGVKIESIDFSGGGTVGTYYPIYQESSTAATLNALMGRTLIGAVSSVGRYKLQVIGSPNYTGGSTGGGIYQVDCAVDADVPAYPGIAPGNVFATTLAGNITNATYLNATISSFRFEGFGGATTSLDVAGIQGSLAFSNVTHTVSGVYIGAGVLGTIGVTSTATVNKVAGVASRLIIENGGTITTYYDLLLSSPIGSGSGMGGVTNYWSIYQESALAKNFLASKLMIGSTTDQGDYILQVTGGAYINATGKTVKLTLGSDATGDIYYRDSSGNIVRLGIGATNDVLTVIGGVPVWLAPAGGGPGGTHTMLSATHTDSTPASVQRGDLITGQGGTPTWSRLAKGTADQYLKSDGTDLLWATITIPATKFGKTGEDNTAAENRAFIIDNNDFEFRSTTSDLGILIGRRSATSYREFSATITDGTGIGQIAVNRDGTSGAIFANIGVVYAGSNETARWELGQGYAELQLGTATTFKINNLAEAVGTKTLRYDPTTDLVTYHDIPTGGGGGMADPGGNGWMVRTALNVSAARTFAGTTNRLTISNPDGTGGNPTFDVGSNIVDKTVATSYTAGATQTFNGDATLPGLNVGPQSGSNPSTLVNGDIWWRSASGLMYAYSSSVRVFVWHDSTQAIFNKSFDNTNTFAVKDATSFTLQNATDTTKQVQFSLAPIATATTIVLTVPSATTTLVGTDSTQTLSNKRLTRRVNTVASSASLTIDSDSTDLYTVTALAATMVMNNPSGTPVNGQGLAIRIKDNGTTRTLTWSGSQWRAGEIPLPVGTIVNKTMYLGFIWNSTDSRWDLVAYVDNF